MALIDCGIGGEKVKVVTSFGIPNRCTRRSGKDNRDGVVVVGSILTFSGNGSFSGGGMVSGKISRDRLMGRPCSGVQPCVVGIRGH